MVCRIVNQIVKSTGTLSKNMQDFHLSKLTVMSCVIENIIVYEESRSKYNVMLEVALPFFS